MFIKSKEGIIVRDPRSHRILPLEGREVPDDRYWQRRLADGDVVLAALPAPNPPPPKLAA